jgi:hypothetical protein
MMCYLWNNKEDKESQELFAFIQKRQGIQD